MEHTTQHALIRHNLGNVFSMLDDTQALAASLQADSPPEAVLAVSTRIHMLAESMRRHMHTLVAQCPASARCPAGGGRDQAAAGAAAGAADPPKSA
jgi:hypothetical protein